MKNKTAIITGGTRGIGLAIAKELAGAGADLILTYKGNEEAAAEAKKELGSTGAKTIIIKSDVSSMEDAQMIAEKAMDEFGQIDILVNNAGITRDGLMLRMKDEDFDAVIDTNLKGSFYTQKFAAKYMAKQRQGRIINISSVVGVVGNIGQANYAAAKAGLIGVTKTAAREFASRNILVNAIAPGFIETPMTKVLHDDVKAAAVSRIPLGRFGKAEEIAELVYFLGSEENTYITGQVIPIDGGMII